MVDKKRKKKKKRKAKQYDGLCDHEQDFHNAV